MPPKPKKQDAEPDKPAEAPKPAATPAEPEESETPVVPAKRKKATPEPDGPDDPIPDEKTTPKVVKPKVELENWHFGHGLPDFTKGGFFAKVPKILTPKE